MGSYRRKDAYKQCERLFTWSQILRNTQCKMPPGSNDFPQRHHLLSTMTKRGSAYGPSHQFCKPLPHALPETWCLTRTHVPASSCSKDRPCAGDNHDPSFQYRHRGLCFCVTVFGRKPQVMAQRGLACHSRELCGDWTPGMSREGRPKLRS